MKIEICLWKRGDVEFIGTCAQASKYFNVDASALALVKRTLQGLASKNIFSIHGVSCVRIVKVLKNVSRDVVCPEWRNNRITQLEAEIKQLRDIERYFTNPTNPTASKSVTVTPTSKPRNTIKQIPAGKPASVVNSNKPEMASKQAKETIGSIPPTATEIVVKPVISEPVKPVSITATVVSQDTIPAPTDVEDIIPEYDIETGEPIVLKSACEMEIEEYSEIPADTESEVVNIKPTIISVPAMPAGRLLDPATTIDTREFVDREISNGTNMLIRNTFTKYRNNPAYGSLSDTELFQNCVKFYFLDVMPGFKPAMGWGRDMAIA